MRIIAKRHLMELAALYGDCTTQVETWHTITRRAFWTNLAEVRQQFPSADAAGDKTVFNIKGNDYRLIVHINYRTGTVYIKDLLTHAVYDKGQWK